MFAINDFRAMDVEEEEAPGEYGIEEEGDDYGDYDEEGEGGDEEGEADYTHSNIVLKTPFENSNFILKEFF